MRASGIIIAFAAGIMCAAPSRADHHPVIAVPGHLSAPVVINGFDVSGAVVEGADRGHARLLPLYRHASALRPQGDHPSGRPLPSAARGELPPLLVDGGSAIAGADGLSRLRGAGRRGSARARIQLNRRGFL